MKTTARNVACQTGYAILFFWLAISLNLQAQVNTGGSAQTSNHNKQVIGYITNWDAWKQASAGVPAQGALTHLNIDYSKYTILNYSFFGVAVDGSLHSGDHRNKQIYQEGQTQQPNDIFHTILTDSWDLHLLFGEMETVYYINQEIKQRAEAQGFVVEVEGTTWEHPGWGLSGGLPLPLHKEDGAPGLLELAHANGVKVMASIGGWSMCKHFPEMAADPVKRAKFIADCQKLINIGFDGIDLDWEYPGPFAGMNFTGSNADFGNFLTLVTELRAAIGPDKLITSAMSASPQKLQGFDWAQLASVMDYFNMMTYDMNGGWSNIAGHNAPVYAYDGAEVAEFNWESTRQALVALGVPANQINFGIPFYGRGVITNGPAGLNAPTLKRSETVQPDGPITTCADFTNWPRDVYDGTPNHFYIQQQTGSGSGWTKHWDDQAKVPYMTKDNFFLSYDDEQSVGIKAQYIKDNGLAGTIIWTVYGDLEMSGTATNFGTKLKRWSNVSSPLVNKINEVFADGVVDPGNESPTVSITSPASGSSFVLGESINLTASANDTDGTVTKVEFYNGSTLLGEDTTSPFSFSWTPTTAGNYSLTARATDNENASTTSTAIQVEVTDNSNCANSGFRVVGYMPSWQGDVNNIQYDKLTHINYSFAIPNSDGTIAPIANEAKLQQLVALAHANGVKVLLAVGGWDLGDGGGNDSRFTTLASSPSTRTAFVNNLMNLVNQYNLDGIDMDWEYPDPDTGTEQQDYELLMQELGAALHAEGQLLTAAVVALGWTGNGITSGVFDDVDFLNIMAYDGGDGALHSPYSYAVDALNYWLGRGLPASKAVVGVPFYGRPSWQGYSALISQGADPYSDIYGNVHYNGINTIKDKTQLALNQASGIMIWELSFDTNDQTSLITAIHEVVGDCQTDPKDPTINITSPSQGAIFNVGDNVSLVATASDADGTVSSVVFNVGGQNINATLSGGNYTASWTAAGNGPVQVVATATDNEGRTGTDQLSITVEDNTNPGCTSPEWVSSQVYHGGDMVSYQNAEYQAAHWTQNQNPADNNSPWGPWVYIGPCDGGGTNEAPSVSITSPANNATFIENQVITINASASDTDGTVTQVAFLVDGAQIAVDNSAPYSTSWTATLGSHTLTAIATDDDGATTTSAAASIQVNQDQGNQPPSVAISSPAAGSSFEVGNTVNITANASDDGSVSKVEFLVDGSLIGEDTSAPYSITWTATAGNHVLVARATDNENLTANSDGVNITVSDGNNSCTAPQYVEGGGYSGGSQVQNAGSLYECKPYPYEGWCNGAAWAYEPGVGDHWQDAWDLVGPCDGGGGNDAPQVSITAPSNGTSYDVGNTVNITANATDTDGTITQVQFLINGSVISTDTSAPYTASWSATQGNHTIVAIATDDGGASTTSSSVSISVGNVTPPPSDLPDRLLVGYWHNFINGAGGMKLSEVSADWDVINVSFAIPSTPTGSNMVFEPDNAIYSSVQEFKNDVAALQSQGKKVLISIGGATGAMHLETAADAQSYSSSMIGIIEEYGFDGLDIDLEGSSLSLSSGDSDFRNPVSPKIVNFISGTQTILNHFGPNFILTAAPETLFVQGGYTGYGGSTGAYLPVIYAFRNDLDYIHVQHYNTGCMLGLDGQCYSQGTADFQVAMAELLLQGFPVPGNPVPFPALRQDQIAIGLPATQQAAGGGYTSPAVVQQALDYLVKGIPYGGNYTLVNSAGYGDFRGLMTWSINWDKAAGFEFSSNHRPYLDALGPAGARTEDEVITTPAEIKHNAIQVFPNPHTNQLTLSLDLDAESVVSASIYNLEGKEVQVIHSNIVLDEGQQSLSWRSDLPTGLYLMKVVINDESRLMKIVKR